VLPESATRRAGSIRKVKPKVMGSLGAVTLWPSYKKLSREED